MKTFKKLLIWLGVVGTISSVSGLLIELFEIPIGNTGKILLCIGLALFLLDIVFTLAELKSDSQKMLAMEGWNIPILQSLYKILDSPVLPIKRIAETTPIIVDQFINVSDKDKKVTVKEPTFIYDYLKNLTSSIPSGSIWIGTSKLNLEIWNDDQSLIFDQILKRRAKENELKVFRLFLTAQATDENETRLKNILKSSNKSTELRALETKTGTDNEDFTIILQPRSMFHNKSVGKTPFETFSSYTKVCLIKYKIDFSSILNSVEITTDLETINQYGEMFDKLWSKPEVIIKASYESPDTIARPFAGRWTGEGFQNKFIDKEDQKFTVSLALQNSSKAKIYGSFNTIFPEVHRNNLSFKVEGYTVDNYLYAHYKQENPTHFGGVAMELSADGTIMTGSYVGYGHLSKGIVKGNLRLKKEP